MAKASKITKIKTTEILSTLSKSYLPTMLDEYNDCSPFQLLVMTLMSARTKDKTTIPIALKLFETNPTPKSFLKSTPAEIAKKIYGIGFHNTKARHIHSLSKILIEKFDGEVPKTMEELTSLPGVGRKTASCVLSYVFNIPAVAVDIHVHRITNKGRLAWLDTKHPIQTEEKLKQLVPKQNWNDINRYIVSHGQNICFPINPNCGACTIKQHCHHPNTKQNSP